MSPDSQEALSIAYCTARIVRLSSGNFCLFAPWSSGHEIIHIGSWAEIEQWVPTFDELSEWHSSETYASKSTPTVDLSNLLGINKPVVKIERRI